MGNPISPKTLKCTIINVEQDPKHPSRHMVSMRIDDGDGEPYVRAVSMLPPNRPISLEEFALNVAEKDLTRPTLPFHYLIEAKNDETEFIVTTKPQPPN